MPEGDTIWRTAHRLDQALAGRVLTRSDLRWPSLSTIDLRGRSTLEVISRGKNLLHRVEGGVTIHSHLRMEGQWRVSATPTLTTRSLANPQLRAVVGNDEWTALGLRLGDLHVVDTAAESSLVGHLGPDVLGPDWDPALATERICSSRSTIGAALLDQRNLAGVGTMYAAELLFVNRVGPWTSTDELSAGQVAVLVDTAHRLLDRGRQHAIQSTTGSERKGETSYVHGRSGRPCRRCGATVRVAMVGDAPRQRTMFYCPRCQGGTAPTDDGRTQRPLGSSSASPSRRPRS